jgi:hypothetical protein
MADRVPSRGVNEELAQLTRILQLSITPIALISGVGLLLLSMTNRLGRVIDRARELGKEAVAAGGAGADVGGGDRAGELRVLFQRARLLQVAIAMIAISAFLAVVMVVALFTMYLTRAHLDWLILLLFAACLLCLVASIVAFLGDIFLSIRWLRLSLGRFV